MTNQDTQNYEVIYEEAGKMEMMKMMAIKEKRIDETFPASVWCSLLRAIAFEKKKLCFYQICGIFKAGVVCPLLIVLIPRLYHDIDGICQPVAKFEEEKYHRRWR